ncbi:hypothetical protein BUALT_Bualt01G0048100 [Buddleja alternifolia]|uniref:Tetratricopeptide repeat-like superfamily protein n=1 Tax=Buddleja alternifolia TaxID=168488 RepID=A0AAV6YF07_9LAMI|nr:hypothetical protein BUALT_Bualt01G0048100 [Buddleja alternifolia]
MRLKAVPSSVECSLAPSSLLTSRKYEMNRSVSLIALSNPFVSKTLLQSRTFKKMSRGRKIRRSCSSNLDDIHHEEPSFPLEGLAKISGRESEGDNNLKRNKKVHYAIPNGSPHGRDRDSFLNTRFDFLEPMMLGIKPEFPDWPDQETVMWASIEQKAKSLEIPLSLRMIKKKLKSEEGFADSTESSYCSVKAAFASMVFIVVELQSYALKMRESLCHEDLDIISSKVQKEMQSSFVWLFQQVFSRTPALMLHVMILLADFSVHSASHNINIESKAEERPIQQYPQINSSVSLNLVSGSGIGEKTQIGDSVYPSDKLESEVEMNLWNSMVDDATKMREGTEPEVIDHEMMRYFVSPVSVELELDGYEDYLRTDLLYQMNLSHEPNNPLLLCNYAQFLHLVAHDYDRAEECFKRAVQVLPPDAESVSQYAIFLWTVRRDFWGAEERFLQALSIEPDNSYYASRYANFLWSTGGEETCFPINNSQNPNS